MESPGQKYCSKCRFDYWSPGTPDYNGEMGMFLCLASETKCDDGLSMYATSRSMKIANGKDCYRYKMKITFWHIMRQLVPRFSFRLMDRLMFLLLEWVPLEA